MFTGHLIYYLAGNLAAACTPSSGMGCFPCCGVTGSTTAVAESGNAALGGAVLIIVIAVLVSSISRKMGGGKGGKK